MATELGVAYLSIVASTKSLAPSVARALGGTQAAATAAGAKAGRGFGGGFANGVRGMKTGALAIGAGIGALVASSVNLEKKFSQTMSVIGATTNAPKRELSKLQQLALDLGASTSFSASEAADAMLELAKAGLSPATIQAGALEGTLQLAAAGGTNLGTAAEIAANALNTFGLEGKDMGKISAALAGASNASTASVESLGEALGQVGPGAKNAGLDLNETVGVLAAFDNAGIKGSDAGTSLKTMLTRLVPQTKAARNAMKDLGLKFTDAQGNFLPIAEVAQQLQDKMKGLTQEQKTTALSTIFGSDATRAATVLMEEGSKGIGKYIKATKDKGAAEKAAKARMSGTAGALERLSGSWETFRLQLGLKIAPVIQTVSDKLGGLIDFLGKNSDKVLIAVGVLAGFAAAILALNVALKVGKALVTAYKVAMAPFVAIHKVALAIGRAHLILRAQLAALWVREKVAMVAHRAAMVASTVATKAATIATRAMNLAMRANPIGIVITAIAALVAGLVWFFTKTKTGKKIVTAVWGAIKTAIKAVADWFTKTAWPAFKKVINFYVGYWKFLWRVVKNVWNGISTAIGTAWNFIRDKVFDKIKLGIKLVRLAFEAYRDLLKKIWKKVGEILKAGWDWVNKNVFGKIKAGLGFLRDRFLWVRDKVKAIWSKFGEILRGGWDWINKNVFAKIKAGIGFVRDRFAAIRTKIGEIWNNLRDRLRDGWNWIRDHVFSRFKDGIDAIRGAFAKARDAIKIIWNKIKGFVKAPAKFIVDTVYNDGIRPMANRVLGWIGQDPLKRVSMKGWATGGYTGPGAKYKPAGVVHADEFVVRKESRKKFERRNPGVLDYLNRTGELPGYAIGGTVAQLSKAARWWQKIGARVTEFGGWGQSVGQHSPGSLHYTGRAADLNYGPGGESDREKAFFDKHLGAFRAKFPSLGVLWRTLGHYNHMHIDTGERGSQIGNLADGQGGGFNFWKVIQKLRNLKDKLSELGSSAIGRVFKGVGRKIINGPIDWIKDRFAQIFGGGGGGSRPPADSPIVAQVKSVAERYGWGSGKHWDAISWLVNKESSWNPQAANPTSSARGLFQKMTSIHGPVEPTAWGQAGWGLNYIKDRYGNPIAAKNYHQSHGYYADGGRVITPKLYDNGGWLPTGTSVVQNKTGRPEPVLTGSQWDAMASGPRIENHFHGITDSREIIAAQERSERRAAVRHNMYGG